MKRFGTRWKVWCLAVALVFAQALAAFHAIEHLGGSLHAEQADDTPATPSLAHAACKQCLAQAAFAVALPGALHFDFADHGTFTRISNPSLPHHACAGFFIAARGPPRLLQNNIA